MSHNLILFTRYPMAGKAKTRLIPALGGEGAAQLQKKMTKHILGRGRIFSEKYPQTKIEIHHSGGNLSLLQAWLGEDLTYIPQAEGDLGKKMYCALENSFTQGAQKALIAGCDCPLLTPEIFAEAFEELEHHDLVLGPALDGGYYLIALKKAIEEIFQDIVWGKEQVLARTLEKAESLKLKVKLLEEMSDVDYPEDLWVWEKASGEKLLC